MRRSEFEIHDKALMVELLHACDYGVLSLIDQAPSIPYGVPLNFAYLEEGIVFHGAKEGKKIELISKNPHASFNAVKPYSFIPSHFSHTTSACPATQFFASVTIQGVVSILERLEDKASALNALMQKMQPENHYEPLSAENPIYTKMLEKTAVLKLEPLAYSVKLKLGQQLSKEQHENIIQQLQKRGHSLDLLTAKLMRQAR